MSDLPPPTPSVPEPELPKITPPIEAPVSPEIRECVRQTDSAVPDGDDPRPKDANERTLGIVIQLIAIVGTMIPPHLPLFGIVPPLVLWLVKRNESPYLDSVGKEVVNFQICLCAIIQLCLLPFIGCITFPLAILTAIAGVVMMVIAAMRTSEGQFYRYPWNVRWIK